MVEYLRVLKEWTFNYLTHTQNHSNRPLDTGVNDEKFLSHQQLREHQWPHDPELLTNAVSIPFK